MKHTIDITWNKKYLEEGQPDCLCSYCGTLIGIEEEVAPRLFKEELVETKPGKKPRKEVLGAVFHWTCFKALNEAKILNLKNK